MHSFILSSLFSQADFIAQLKVAPEWAPVLSAVQSTGSSAHRRRKLNGHMREGSATKSAIDALHVHLTVDLAPRLVVLASFPLGLVSRKAPAAATVAPKGTKLRKVAWDLPAAAAEDWKAPLTKLVADSGAACQPILTPAASGVHVAVCPQVCGGGKDLYMPRYSIGRRRKSGDPIGKLLDDAVIRLPEALPKLAKFRGLLFLIVSLLAGKKTGLHAGTPTTLPRVETLSPDLAPPSRTSTPPCNGCRSSPSCTLCRPSRGRPPTTFTPGSPLRPEA